MGVFLGIHISDSQSQRHYVFVLSVCLYGHPVLVSVICKKWLDGIP